MKKLTAILTILGALTILSCDAKNENKEGKSDGAAAAAANLMSCDVGGKGWKTAEVSDVVSSKLMISLAGTNLADKSIVIVHCDRAKATAGAVLPFEFKMGRIETEGVTFRTLDENGMALFDQDDNMPKGSITITKANKSYVEGTFTATSETHKITNGKFAMELTKVW
jgi:hypothetical protein